MEKSSSLKDNSKAPKAEQPRVRFSDTVDKYQYKHPSESSLASTSATTSATTTSQATLSPKTITISSSTPDITQEDIKLLRSYLQRARKKMAENLTDLEYHGTDVPPERREIIMPPLSRTGGVPLAMIPKRAPEKYGFKLDLAMNEKWMARLLQANIRFPDSRIHFPIQNVDQRDRELHYTAQMTRVTIMFQEYTGNYQPVLDMASHWVTAFAQYQNREFPHLGQMGALNGGNFVQAKPFIQGKAKGKGKSTDFAPDTATGFWSNERVEYNRADFLATLYEECPSRKGKLQMAVAICLMTAFSPEEVAVIEDIEDLMTLSVDAMMGRSQLPGLSDSGYVRLQMMCDDLFRYLYLGFRRLHIQGPMYAYWDQMTDKDDWRRLNAYLLWRDKRNDMLAPTTGIDFKTMTVEEYRALEAIALEAKNKSEKENTNVATPDDKDILKKEYKKLEVILKILVEDYKKSGSFPPPSVAGGLPSPTPQPITPLSWKQASSKLLAAPGYEGQKNAGIETGDKGPMLIAPNNPNTPVTCTIFPRGSNDVTKSVHKDYFLEDQLFWAFLEWYDPGIHDYMLGRMLDTSNAFITSYDIGKGFKEMKVWLDQVSDDMPEPEEESALEPIDPNDASDSFTEDSTPKDPPASDFQFNNYLPHGVTEADIKYTPGGVTKYELKRSTYGVRARHMEAHLEQGSLPVPRPGKQWYPHEVTFTSHFGLAPPSPRLLKLHRAISMAASSSGAWAAGDAIIMAGADGYCKYCGTQQPHYCLPQFADLSMSEKKGRGKK
ncbi:hypothetical protein AA313_de0205173 [Arthrobotrys entomopaga]|nr:hypothetical protein AA313_de0205173 [Arthrobotrys entomopaga]